MVVRGRWASPMRLLVYKRTGLVVFKTAPWSGRISLSARDGPSVPKERKTQRARLSRLLHWGSAPSVRQPGCRTAGCERALCWRRLPCVSIRHMILCCEYSESTMLKKSASALSARAAARCARSRGCGAVKLLSTQIVRKQAKAISSQTTQHIACSVVVNAFQQYERLAGLATAKLERR